MRKNIPLRVRQCDKSRYENSLREYYKNPKICVSCGEPIKILKNQYACEVMKKRFCNASCAATYNNHNSPNRPKTGQSYICPDCKKKKHRDAVKCSSCKTKDRVEALFMATLSSLTNLESPSRCIYNEVRKHAKDVMAVYGMKRACIICGYERVVDVCHKIPISSFQESALIGEVNGLKNICFMCKNHHSEFDLRIMDKEEMSKFNEYFSKYDNWDFINRFRPEGCIMSHENNSSNSQRQEGLLQSLLP